jgi:hypothetical protein
LVGVSLKERKDKEMIATRANSVFFIGLIVN